MVTYVSPEKHLRPGSKGNQAINVLLGADQEIKLNYWQIKSTGFLSATKEVWLHLIL